MAWPFAAGCALNPRKTAFAAYPSRISVTNATEASCDFAGSFLVVLLIGLLVGKRSYTRLGIDDVARRIILARSKLLQRLHIDQRRHAILRRYFVAGLERLSEFFFRAHILAARAQPLGHLVVAQVLLEQIHVHGSWRPHRARPHTPGIVVEHHADHRDLVLRGRIQLKHAVRDSGIAG